MTLFRCPSASTTITTATTTTATDKQAIFSAGGPTDASPKRHHSCETHMRIDFEPDTLVDNREWRTPSCSVSTSARLVAVRPDRPARGKVQELRDELRQSGDKRDKGYARRKTVLKKIVANMTMGNDSEFTVVGREARLTRCSVTSIPGYGVLYADTGPRYQKEYVVRSLKQD